MKPPKVPKITSGTVLWAVIVAVLAAAVSVQLYLRLEAAAVGQHVALKRQEIARAQSSGLGQLTPDELTRLRKRVGAFQRGFVSLSQAAMVLDGISDQAERIGVKVVTVSSSQPEVIKDEDGAEFEMGGAKYSRLSIKMRLEGSSREIADFLRALAVSSERIFAVDALTIANAPGRPGVVACDVAMSFFSNNT